MSRMMRVYLERRRVPVRRELQEALAGLPLGLVVDPKYAAAQTPSGYLPFTLSGVDAGCEVKFQPLAAATVPDALRMCLGARDTELIIRWGGDPRERATAEALALALVRSARALVEAPPGQLCDAQELAAALGVAWSALTS